ncbi:hypothetical protein ABK040_001331 [Willaertia magna]
MATNTIKLTSEETVLFQQTFNLFDKDGDGFIGKDELGDTLRSLGNTITENDLEDLMKEINPSKAGSINFQEFCIILKTPSVDQPKVVMPTRRKTVTGSSPSARKKSLFGTFGFGKKEEEKHGRRHSAVDSAINNANNKPVNGNFVLKLFQKKKEEEIEEEEEGVEHNTGPSLEDMKGVFGIFDANNDGFISVSEFRSMSQKLGIGLIMDEGEVRQLFNIVDSDKDGYISFDEFVRLFNLA